MKPRKQTTSLLLFYGSAALWNLGNGMMMILFYFRNAPKPAKTQLNSS